MNRKQLIVLLAALVILGGVCLMLLNNHEKSWESSEGKQGEKLLPNFQVNDVAAIHIKDEGELNLVKKDDKWRVRERNDYPANFSQISDLLIKLGDLKIVQSEPIGASQLARMHLAEGNGPDAATLVEFKDAQGKVFQTLLLGKKHTSKSARPSRMPFGDMEMPDGRYVMLKSDPHDVLTVSDPLNSVDPKASGWLNKDFFKVEKLKSVSFVSTNAADSWSITHESENGPWVMANLKTNEVLDTNKLSSLSSSLGYASFVDVDTNNSADKTGMDKPILLTIETFDHFTYKFKIGSKTPENNYNLNVAVTADFPTQRVESKDEKPDFKAKADKEFQEKLKPLQEKLAKEKSLDQWTYLVNTWLVDPFIRPRAQLMMDKKDEKKGDKKDAGAASEPIDDKNPAENPFPAPADDNK